MQRIKISALVIFLMAIVWANKHTKLKRWTEPPGIISSDVAVYYSYLPAIFIYKDLTLNFIETPGFQFVDKIWGFSVGKGRVLKMSMGLSILNLPFFLIAHAYCLVTNTEATGYSVPYEIALLVSSLFYVIVGMVFLRRLLRLYFNEWITAVCLLVIGLGTNLFNYATYESCMSHAYLFCLINIFTLYVYKWYQASSIRNTIVLGVTGGLIALIRPTDILVFFLFFLYNITSFKELKSRIISLSKLKIQMALMVILFLCIWSPQLAYWKFLTGKYFFFSYVGDKFYFNGPHITEGLFSYRKGWLLYSPLLIFSLAGFFWMRSKIPGFFSGSLIFLISSIYVIFSFWCWWYGGSFGQRPFIDMYGVLALPMGCFFSADFNQNWWKRTVVLLSVTFLVYLNLFQSNQYVKGLIHYEAMTKKAYWAVFLKGKMPMGWHYLLQSPDSEGARLHNIEKHKRK